VPRLAHEVTSSARRSESSPLEIMPTMTKAVAVALCVIAPNTVPQNAARTPLEVRRPIIARKRRLVSCRRFDLMPSTPRKKNARPPRNTPARLTRGSGGSAAGGGALPGATSIARIAAGGPVSVEIVSEASFGAVTSPSNMPRPATANEETVTSGRRPASPAPTRSCLNRVGMAPDSR